MRDKLVGPHMELLRNICDPSSVSKPHVTVRYSDELIPPAADFDRPVRYIDLVEARAFGLEEPASRARFTIYIKASSDELEFLHYKQGYPDSEFHVTAYNGSSKNFAEHLLLILRKFDWHLRIPLPRGTRLEEIPVRAERLKKADTPRSFDPAVAGLFKKITSLDMTWPLIRDMADYLRLELAEQVCTHLMNASDAIRHSSPIDNEPPSENLDADLTTDERPEIYLTPPELARDVARLALRYHKKKIPIRFGDPAVGTGAFYAALLETSNSQGIESAIGIDISRTNLAIARKKWGHKGLQLRLADFLHLEDLPPRSLILANPPYLRQQRIDPGYKWKLRERASVKSQMVVSGLSGLYVYFMLLCDTWMEDGGIAAWLIPSEFMQTDYGAAIRKYLTERVQLIRIHKFDIKPRFEGVDVYPAVVVFRKNLPKKGGKVFLTSGGSLFEPHEKEQVMVEDLRKEAKWRIPREIAKRDASSDVCLGDLFDIRRGIATGANEFFVLSRDRVIELGIPSEALLPLLPKAHLIAGDIIEAESDGRPSVSQELSLLSIDMDETEIEKKFPRLSEYLHTAIEKGVRNRTLVKSRKRWYKQESRKPSPFLCTYMGREKANGPPLRFLWNKSKAIVTNTYLMLYPKTGLNEVLENDPSKMEELFELLKISAEKTMKEKWRLHAHGLHKIEPRELGQVRLIDEPQWISDALGSQVR